MTSTEHGAEPDVAGDGTPDAAPDPADGDPGSEERSSAGEQSPRRTTPDQKAAQLRVPRLIENPSVSESSDQNAARLPPTHSVSGANAKPSLLRFAIAPAALKAKYRKE